MDPWLGVEELDGKCKEVSESSELTTETTSCANIKHTDELDFEDKFVDCPGETTVTVQRKSASIIPSAVEASDPRVDICQSQQYLQNLERKLNLIRKSGGAVKASELISSLREVRRDHMIDLLSDNIAPLDNEITSGPATSYLVRRLAPHRHVLTYEELQHLLPECEAKLE